MPTQSESSSLVTAGQLVRALYDYTAESGGGKVLNIYAGELFIVIKFTKPDEWLYVVSESGSLGYIPANFVRNQPMHDEELLKLVEGMLQRLGPASDRNVVTARQVNHARVKLTQLRYEITQRIHFDKNSVSTLEDGTGESLCESIRSEDQGVQTSPSLIENKKKEEGLSGDEDEDGSEERVEEITSNTREQTVDSSAELHSNVLDDHIAIPPEAEEMRAEPRDPSPPTQEGEEKREEGTANTIESAHSPIQIAEPNHCSPQMDSPQETHVDCHVIPKDGNQSACQSLKEQDNDQHSPPQSPCDHDNDDDDDDDFSDQLASELIEKVRVCSELNHELCKKTVNVVIRTLGEAFPSWKTKCHQIATRLHKDRLKFATPQETADSERIRAIFKRLWSCQNDEQQRSWPIHEDASMILHSLQELTTLLADANPAVTRAVISQNDYAHVTALTTYFVMETRKSIRMQLCSVFLEVIRLNNAIIPNLFLPSVLPNCLAEEMLNYFNDTERWTTSATLFSALFSTGHKPLNTLHDHVNDKFVSKMINIVERVDEDGNKVDTGIPSESSIPPILSFNLHFDSRESNLVLKALKSRKTATQLTENLVSYLNWGEDPTLVPKVISSSAFETGRRNAVHKLLTEILEEEETAKLFYLNDIRVIIDIVITHLNNLNAGDQVKQSKSSANVLNNSGDIQERLACLIICDRVLRNTAFLEEPHKSEELLKCLDGILENENSSAEEKSHAAGVRQLLLSAGSTLL